MADRVVQEAWSAHRRWSQVADAAHRAIDQRRLGNLALLIAAAVAGAFGGLIDHTVTQRICAAVATALLALAAILQRRLDDAQIGSWIDTRIASEGIKAAVYRSLVVGDDTSSAALAQAIEDAEKTTKAHLLLFESTPSDGKALPTVTDLDSYVSLRARDQANWHRGKLDGLRSKGGRLRRIELALTILGVIMGAIAAATDVSRLAAVVTLLTTAAGVVAAHIGATKYERVAAGYARTANRIDRAIGVLPDQPEADRTAAFVDEVETILAQQNENWAAISSPS